LAKNIKRKNKLNFDVKTIKKYIMSVLSYLENTVETVKIADWERAPILTSIPY
jgi:hypothetical protein